MPSRDTFKELSTKARRAGLVLVQRRGSTQVDLYPITPSGLGERIKSMSRPTGSDLNDEIERYARWGYGDSL